MYQNHPLSRRRLLQQLLVGMPLAAVAVRAVQAAGTPLAVDSPEAKALGYTEDAKSAKESAGHHCGECALYQGGKGSAQGPCQIFPGKEVKATGWCRSWSPQV
jgi:hypothetical protein